MVMSKRYATGWALFVDGASRNNPGPSGAGIVLLYNGDPRAELGFFLGKKTNNQAEYLALILGLCEAKKQLVAGDALGIYSDSELLIRQLQGRYKVKNPELKILYECVMGLLYGVPHSLHHVLRAANARADELANYGIDHKIPVPSELQHFCLER